MNALIGFVRFVDVLNERLGRFISWFTLATVLVCFSVVVLRYAFGIGILWLQELYIWFHALVFLVGAGYTFLHGGHVRVDLLYEKRSVRGKAWTDLIGTIVFLLPWLAVVIYYTVPFVQSSWEVKESSPQGGGMQALYVLKSFILVFCITVGLQGLALMSRSILLLRGHPEFQPQSEELPH
ncbi:MAG: TRAP transporter small permease subunit [Alphaproteobacteria bacterium]|nr:TRAP transporter small permease subunit [Alphaproteobacteria bacterium]MBU0795974.1 TRAP transporter small permease subunit [Alphaproteobacteria bacterium]MBU0885662.1 TRAP transporter small permease subunit [Alphaproteobacteria bacterium]MBU1812682.1 TRAP transporter small permease subunit [Alphaproteobacteria bacterium]